MKKALIVHGGWNGHEPKQTAELFGSILEKEGFAVTIMNKLKVFAKLDLKGFDLIIPIWTNGEISGKECRAVMAAVESGVGLAGCHGGMCDAFHDNVDWQFMTGAQWVAHPGGEIDYTVNILPTGSPLTEGIKDFKVKSEQYYIHVDPANKVLATTRFPVADGPHAANGEVDVPVAYTRLWGKGRIYYNSLGHVTAVFKNSPEATEMMKRGLLWAAR